MTARSITLYVRPSCDLCSDARAAISRIVRAAPTTLTFDEVDIESDPELHRRFLADIPVVEYRGHLLPHATSQMRIEAFLGRIDDGVLSV